MSVRRQRFRKPFVNCALNKNSKVCTALEQMASRELLQLCEILYCTSTVSSTVNCLHETHVEEFFKHGTEKIMV
jgi:hypothetical protein